MAKPETLKRALLQHNIQAEIVDEINRDFENVTNKSAKKKKAQYLCHAVTVLDAKLDENTRRELMESCACTFSSSLEKKVEQLAKTMQGLSLEEKLQKLGKIKHLENPVIQEDGTILISFGTAQDGAYSCPCPQISGVEIKTPMTFTYCMCCAGHFKYQYEKALGAALEIKQISSSLESAGKKPCVFVLTVLENV